MERHPFLSGKQARSQLQALIFSVVTLLSSCTTDHPPEYTIEIAPGPQTYGTVFTGSSITISAYPFLNLNDNLIFGPVPYDSDFPISWSSGNPAIGTVTHTTQTEARIDGIRHGWVVITATYGPSVSSYPVRVMRKTENQLTTGNFTRGYPRFSPDGSQIAYSRDGKICTVPSGSAIGTETVLTPDSRYARQLCWSPDGSKIAFVANIESNYSAYLYCVNITTGLIERLSDLSGESPQWSPDGQSIAFFYNSRIYLVPATGGAAFPLTEYKGSSWYEPRLRWSPDGQRIVYNYSDKIYLVNVSTGTEMLLVSNTTGDWGNRLYPQWSPDGSTIIYVRNDADIYAIPATGGAEALVVHSPTNVIGTEVVMSPLEPFIIFYDRVDLLMAVSLDGTELFRLNDGLPANCLEMQAYDHLAFSPDGLKITFARFSDILTSQIWQMQFPHF